MAKKRTTQKAVGSPPVASNDTASKDPLQRGIEKRQAELHRDTMILAKAANVHKFRAAFATSMTIVLGAMVATRDVAESVIAVNSTVVVIVYTTLGVLIAAIAGFEAAFGNQDKAIKLNLLAAACESTKRSIDTNWRKNAGSLDRHDPLRAVATSELIDAQDARLADVSTQAAELGVNLPHEVGELIEWQNPHPA